MNGPMFLKLGIQPSVRSLSLPLDNISKLVPHGHPNASAFTFDFAPPVNVSPVVYSDGAVSCDADEFIEVVTDMKKLGGRWQTIGL